MSASFDTLDDVTDDFMSYEALHARVFRHLEKYVGIVITGAASPALASEQQHWGRPLFLETKNDGGLREPELMQIRLHPPRFFQTAAEVRPRVVIIATRRRFKDGGDETTLAVLWPPVTLGQNTALTLKALTEGAVAVVGARNIHIALPSIFSEHHMEEPRITCPVEWKYHVYDSSHYHAVRSTTFSISKSARLPSGTPILVTLASTGVSPWFIASKIANTNVIDDAPLRLAEPINAPQWSGLQTKFSSKLTAALGEKAALEAMINSYAACDVLTCEGLLGLLCCQEILDGAMPDMLYLPGGFPLLISFAVRIACYPERFGLQRSTNYDALSVQEACSAFESYWPTIEIKGKGVYAIDVAMRTAWESARENDTADAAFEPSADAIQFFQRAGQRCINAIFGQDVEAKTTERAEAMDKTGLTQDLFGSPDRMIDPLSVARDAALKQIGYPESTEESILPCSFSNHSKTSKRRKLLTLMSDVEKWLRTGVYENMQIHTKNEEFPPQVVTRKPTVDELRRALDSGVQKSVNELVASGDAESATQAAEAAAFLRKNIEQIVKTDNGEVDMDALNVMMSTECVETLRAREEEQQQVENAMRRIVCMDAFQQAVSCLGAAMCQGSAVHFQFNLQIFLATSGAKNACPDCGEGTHALSATILSTRHSTCSVCRKWRCHKCAMHATASPCKLCVESRRVRAPECV
jgi:hypothetical protein